MSEDLESKTTNLAEAITESTGDIVQMRSEMETVNSSLSGSLVNLQSQTKAMLGNLGRDLREQINLNKDEIGKSRASLREAKGELEEILQRAEDERSAPKPSRYTTFFSHRTAPRLIERH